MNTKVTPELLALCLADIQSGRSTVEECVAAHPDVAVELRSLLGVALSIPALPPVAPDPAFRLRARAKLSAAINAERNSVTNSFLPRYWWLKIGNWGQPRLSPRRSVAMPALIVVLIVALTTATGGGAVYASQDSLPGDALYPVKTTVEQVQLTLAVGDEAKAQAHIALAGKRISEVEKASQKLNTRASNAAAEGFVREITEADRHLARAAGSSKDVSGLLARLATNLDRHEKALAAVEAHAPDQAKDALARAAKAAAKGLNTASGRLDSERGRSGKPSSGPAAGGEDRKRPSGGRATDASPEVRGIISSTVAATVTQAISDVEKLATDPNVSGQSYEGLLAKLRAAQEAAGRGQPEVAVRVLDAFLNELNAFHNSGHNSGHISADNYANLYSRYADLVSSLGGSPEPQAAVVGPSSGRAEAAPTPRGKK